jgi:hypothetical protein
MRRPDTAVLLLAFALIACGGDDKTEANAPGQEAAAAEAPSAPAAAALAQAERKPTEFWLFKEFDWGDSKETVYESVDYTDGFLCYRHKLREHCAFVKTRVDGEDLLANFHFVDGVLWRADILTPDLDETQAAEHLERVWKLLTGYVTRFQGEAPEQAAFGDWKAIPPGQMRVTHRWVQPTQEIRIVVGHSQAENQGWFTAVRVVDPKWAMHEPAFVADPKS